MGNSERHNYYIFPKTQKFFSVIRALLKELDFKTYKTYKWDTVGWKWNAFGRPVDKKWGEPIYNKEEDIKKYIDRRYVFEKDEYLIEIVFGKEKVFLMIHTDKDKQQKLAKFMNRFILYTPQRKKGSVVP